MFPVNSTISRWPHSHHRQDSLPPITIWSVSMEERWVDHNPGDNDEKSATSLEAEDPLTVASGSMDPSLPAAAAFNSEETNEDYDESNSLAPESPTDSEDRKPAARERMPHPYDHIFASDVEQDHRRHPGRPDSQEAAADLADQFQVSFGIPFAAASPSDQYQRMYDTQHGANSHFAYHPSMTVQHDAPPPVPPYASYPSYHSHHHQMMQQPMPPIGGTYYSPGPSRREAPQAVEQIHPASRLQPRQHLATPPRNNSPAAFRRSPSPEELEEARTARARQALQTWYKRLADLYRYKLLNGNCKLLTAVQNL